MIRAMTDSHLETTRAERDYHVEGKLHNPVASPSGDVCSKDRAIWPCYEVRVTRDIDLLLTREAKLVEALRNTVERIEVADELLTEIRDRSVERKHKGTLGNMSRSYEQGKADATRAALIYLRDQDPVTELAEARKLLKATSVSVPTADVDEGQTHYGFFESMRDHDPIPRHDGGLTCWAYTTPDKLNACILERGHDNGKHEGRTVGVEA